MPPGRPTRTSRRTADLLAHLTSIGTLDPADPATTERALYRLMALIKSYRDAGDTRPLKLYVAHIEREKEE